MKPPPFAYSRPTEVDEALWLLADAGEDAKLLAGGQSLLPLLALRLARPTHLVDITRLSGLDRIDPTEHGGLSVGALATHARLERAVSLGPAWRALTECAGLIGHYPIRVRGTAGGSFAHADPSAELAVAAHALDAVFVARSRTGSRRISVDNFFTGPFTTTLEVDEMIVRIEFPPVPDGRVSVFEEFATRSGDFASASVAVALTRGEDGSVRDVRIAVGAVAPTPLRASEAEAALDGTRPRAAQVVTAARLAAQACRREADRGDDQFRRELVQVLTQRAFRRLKVSA